MKVSRTHPFIHSFAVQLVFHHLKKNLLLLFLWVLFVAAVLGGIGPVYGIHLLFLDPEYLGQVNFLSFFIVGIALGNFIMAFHITTYILNSHYFSFVGVLEQAFRKYMVNNGVIPAIAVCIYAVAIIVFQLRNGNPPGETLLEVTGLLLGIWVTLIAMQIYFRWTNQDIFRYLAGSVDKQLRKSVISRNRVMNRLREAREQQYQVTNYLDLRLRRRSCEGLLNFYNKEAVIRVFDQNHFNSVLLEIVVILLVLSLAWLIEYPLVQIPAAASTLLLFAMLVMLLGGVIYWFKGWGIPFLAGIFILANFSSDLGFIGSVNTVRGLDYSTTPAVYTVTELKNHYNQTTIDSDWKMMVNKLNSWKALSGEDQPRLNLLCVSGGGQRAALWTLHVLRETHRLLRQDLMDHTVLITGASGGMIGASYYRELLRLSRETNSVNLLDTAWLTRMGRDNLNPIILSLVTNDALFKFRRYSYGEHTYVFDRGYMFERQLDTNLNGMLDKPLLAYRTPEMTGQLPTMIFAPVISNDGRKLYVSASPVSFMTQEDPRMIDSSSNYKIRGIDFVDFFQDQGSGNLNFLSALRMSASFPYITPVISLPTAPRIEVMDAGISDNFGISDALHFVSYFREWIEANTSGVVLTIIRDTHKLAPIDPRSNSSIVDRMTNPISSVYNNLANMQDITNDTRIVEVRNGLAIPLDVVEFEYDAYAVDPKNYLTQSRRATKRAIKRASLSWHLTGYEKKAIIDNIHEPNNRVAMDRLINLLDHDTIR